MLADLSTHEFAKRKIVYLLLKGGTHGSRPLQPTGKDRRDGGQGGFRTTFKDSERHTMDDDVIDLLKAHEYFRGISGAILGEIASFAKVTNYDAAAVIHQLNDPLTSICFILRGRLKAVRGLARR